MKVKNTASVTLLASAILGITGCQHLSSNSVAVAAHTGKFVMPSYTTITLENGVTLKLMPKTAVPLMHVTIATNRGSLDDPIAGTASLTNDALLLGTDRYTKHELEQKVGLLGSQIHASTYYDHSEISADFMAKDVTTMLAMLQDVWLHPSFNGQEFTKHKQALVAELENDKQSPREVSTRYFMSQVFEGSPYGNIANRDTLNAINVNDVNAYYHAHYQPQNTVISVVGDFDSKKMQQQLRDLFAKWKADSSVSDNEHRANIQRAQAHALASTKAADKPEVLLVNKSDSNITTFMIGAKGVKATNPDLTGIQVVNTVLGGRFTSWLNNALRIDSGLTYGAYSYFTPLQYDGMFSMSSFTKTSSTDDALALTMKTYQRLWDKGMDAATLASAKAYMKGQFPRRYETNAEWASFLTKEYVYGLNDEQINQFQQRVDSLTLQDTNRIIHQYFPLKNLQFVLVGNAKKIAPIAKKYGDLRQVDIQAVGFGEPLSQ